MKVKTALEFSWLIDDMCAENGVQVESTDTLWDVTVKMVQKQDKAVLESLYQRFCKRSSRIAMNLTAAIEEEWKARAKE